MTNKLNLVFLTALLGYEGGFYRAKTAFWPEMNALLQSPDELFERMEKCVRNVVFQNMDEDSTLDVNRIFARTPAWNFDFEATDEGVEPIPIAPTTVIVPTLVDRRENRFVNLRFDVFISRAEQRRIVWVPFFNRFFSIAAEEDANETIVKAIQQIVARCGLEENPSFVDHAASVSDVRGYLFRFDLPTETPSVNDDELICVPESLGMKRAEIVSKESVCGFEQEIKQITDAFEQPIPESVLLLGPPGSGKTALWRKFVAVSSEKFQSFWEADAVLLAASLNPASDVETLGRWASGQTTVFHLGNLWEIDQTGKSFSNNVSLADVLVPFINRGELPTIVECSPEQYADLDRNHPAILAPFMVVPIPESETKQDFAILRTMNRTLAAGAISDDGLARLESLLRRYSPYEAIPGAAASLMRRPSLKTSEQKKTIGEREIVEAFAERSKLPRFMLDPSIPLDWEATRNFFCSRVIGQGEDEADSDDKGAIPILLDLIETVKAQITKKSGPIASLLFVGPTGVGKTELAKTLAEFFYGSPKKMVRIDMNEYSQIDAADRLINGSATGEGILTSAVRAQPLGVVLLDEFEKAHPSVFDLLLQILGEGRLTDAQGRLADFSNSVVILTSNLGMERFGKKSLGFEHENETLSASEYFLAEAARLLRPELLNRIDRLVPFRPLSPRIIRRILERELTLLEKRQGIALRDLTIKIDETVKDELVRLGYDERYGARSTRRTLERELLRPLADVVADMQPNVPLNVHFKLIDGKICVVHNRRRPKTTKDENDRTEKERDQITVCRWKTLRDSVNDFRTGSLFSDLRAEVEYLLQEQAKEKALYEKRNEHWQYYQQQAAAKDEIETKHNLLARIDRLFDEICSQETQATLDWISGRSPNAAEVDDAEKNFERFKRDLYAEDYIESDIAGFWLHSTRTDFLLYYLCLIEQFCDRNDLRPVFWFGYRHSKNNPLSDLPSNAEKTSCYPKALSVSEKDEFVAIDAKSLFSRSQSANKNSFDMKENRLVSFWKTTRGPKEILDASKISPLSWKVDFVLMTGIDDPFYRRVFDSASGVHAGKFLRDLFQLDFFPAKTNLRDFCQWEKYSSNEYCRWEFSEEIKPPTLIPWKTGKIKIGNGSDFEKYCLETGVDFPNLLFFKDYFQFLLQYRSNF